MIISKKQLAITNLLNAVRLVVAATKTFEYYLRTLQGMVRELYRGDISENDFVTQMSNLIEQQLTRAFHEGMRVNGYEPEDMEPEWADKLEEIILSEYDYVDNFAADIVALSEEMGGFEEGWDPLLARAETWANRYNDVVNLAILMTSEQKLEWELGATEVHCDTCGKLNGIVARASIWELANVRPQNPPNNALTCGGWNCDCSLNPTDARQTRGAWDAIQRAIG